MQKALHAIRQAEHNHDSKSDKDDASLYSIGYGGKKLANLADHPGNADGAKGQMPAGANQIQKDTWNVIADKLGLADFSAHSQDLAAVSLIDNRHQLENVESGHFLDKSLPSLSKEWAALPQGPGKGSYYGQPSMPFDVLKVHYDHY